MTRGDSATCLAPGFRFHPTDEELVRYYLKRKLTNKPFRFDPISLVDIYKSEPWDLPGKSKLKTRDLEWYFFSALDKKYGNGSKTNRATEKGYWKTTGKDRTILSNSKVVGMKKTLVYHLGRAPRGERTNWVMHEYRLADEDDLRKAGVLQDALVLCRVFQKSGTGPKNGEKYGAPFVEEEWDDDQVAVLPDEDMMVADEVLVGGDAYLEPKLDQNVDVRIASENAAAPSNFYYGETSHYVEHPRYSSEDDQKPLIGAGGTHYASDLPYSQHLPDLPGQYDEVEKPVRGGYIAESRNNMTAFGTNYLLDEKYLQAIDNSAFSEGLFLEDYDLSKPVESDSTGDSTDFDMVDEYLNFFDAVDDNLTFDPSESLGSKDDVSIEAHPSQMDVIGGTKVAFMACKELSETHGSTDASSSEQKPKATISEPDAKHAFIKQGSHMLGNIPAPPAFASELPTKDAAIRLNSASTSSFCISAGMVRIESITLDGNELDWPLGKSTNVNIILSFGLSQGNVGSLSSAPMAGLFSGKTETLVSRGWLFLMFSWVLILSVSYKIGTYVCAK